MQGLNERSGTREERWLRLALWAKRAVEKFVLVTTSGWGRPSDGLAEETEWVASVSVMYDADGGDGGCALRGQSTRYEFVG